MKIKLLPHKTLSEAAASKLAASLLDGSLQPGTQLPPERELMNQIGISRTTLREALKALEENNLIESRPNIGWFVREIDETNITQAKELGNPTQLWKTHQALGNLQCLRGKTEKARAEFQAALKVVEGIAEGLTDSALKEGYLQSEPVQKLVSLAQGPNPAK